MLDGAQGALAAPARKRPRIQGRVEALFERVDERMVHDAVLEGRRADLAQLRVADDKHRRPRRSPGLLDEAPREVETGGFKPLEERRRPTHVPLASCGTSRAATQVRERTDLVPRGPAHVATSCAKVCPNGCAVATEERSPIATRQPCTMRPVSSIPRIAV